MVIHRWGLPLAALAALLMAGGCDSEPETAAAEHMRALLESGEGVVELPSTDTLQPNEHVLAFYDERGHEPAWTVGRELTPGGARLLEALGASSEDGLEPARYRFGEAKALSDSLSGGELSDSIAGVRAAQLDLVLSEGFARYAHDLVQGTLDPKGGGVEWTIPRESLPEDRLILAAARADDPGELLRSLRPAHPYYRRLVAALAQYREVADRGGWPTVPEAASLAEGDSSTAVASLRARLIGGGDPEERRLAQEGSGRAAVFDAKLMEALERFQRRHGIVDDGAVGPTTVAELNRPVEERIFDLRVNLDRWRWLPRDLGDLYVLVNVAGFELEVVEEDSAILAMNVVVGRDAWRTPIFRDTMEHVVVNPYWNVPASIEEDELIPAVRRDPGYLDRNNFEVVHAGSNRVVHPGSIDHQNLDAYQFRQKPGPDNALGQIKFLFPNKNNIYLHDTPAGHLFSQTSRAFSHGCIRVEHALELGRLVLEKATDTSPARLDELLASKDEQWINLTKPIPVYILYFTAWVDGSGAVRFHPDIYDRDQRLRPDAERQLAAAPLPVPEADR